VRLLHRPLIIGHRGAPAELPENTLAAFDRAVKRGADGIEFDVHLSSDDVPVVIHDPCLERTTSGSGRVRDHRAAALRRLDAGAWFNQRYPSKARAQNAGLKIPLLEEALEWVRDRRCQAFVEIKEGGKAYPGIEARVVEEIARSGVAPLATVISFDFPTLERCRALDRDLRLGIIFSRPLHALSQARTISATSLHPHWIFSSPRFVQHAQRAGLQVVVWGVENPAALRQQMVSGIDALITDHPARATRICSAMLKAVMSDE
jgi:glycerophosphoryl diester phosphodiesterase